MNAQILTSPWTLATEQFPIRGFNDTATDFDKTILKLIEFEQAQIEKLKLSQSKNDIGDALARLDDDIKELSHSMQAFDESVSKHKANDEKTMNICH